jgi:threonyl-tRNA synthetase
MHPEEAESLGIDPTNVKITVYRLEDEDTGEDLFVDLCRGPHVASVQELRTLGFKLDKFSGCYWRGDQKRNIQMQRIYALVFASQAELQAFLDNREEAKKRDHRVLGQQLELFIINDEVGAGLPMYLPRGGLIRQTLERYCYQEAKKVGYQYVYTPHIGKSTLFARSGHLDHYRDGMYAPIEMVNLKGEGKDETGKGELFYLKPMNCPMHHYIYLSKPRSYRDLPFRLYEYGTVYRYEDSGVLSGLIRVRGFTQNDAHVYCTPEQLKEVIGEAIDRFTRAYRDIGITDYKIRFSLPDFENDKEKYGEETPEWRESISAMRRALDELQIDYYDAIGEAAFYGPKIDFQVKNVNGKEDTLSTIQVDYSIAPKFNITYKDKDGQDKTPVIIHMALMGSIDRFMAFMLEMTGGRLPFWLAPEQVRILTINDQVLDYVDKIKLILSEIVLMEPLKYNELRFGVDDRPETLNKKIRDAEIQKIPIILIVGPKDKDNNEVSIRTHEQGEIKVKLTELKNFISNFS